MEKQFSAEDAAISIRPRRITKEEGLPKDIDVSGICHAAGISHETCYECQSYLP